MIKYFYYNPAYNASPYMTSQYPSPQAPNLISGLSAWFAAGTNQSSYIESASISTWSSSFQSGGVVAVTQSVAENQPTYQFNGPNGKTYLKFDGVNDFLEGTSITAYSAFIVSNYTKSSSFSGYAGAFGLDGQPDPIFTGNDGTKSWSTDYGTYYVNTNETASLGTLSSWAISYVTSDYGGSGTGKIKIGDDRYIGLSRYWGGGIAEIICYNRTLTFPEMIAMFQYLNDKYKIY